MKGPWKVTNQMINGQKIYQVFRFINPARADNSFNREYFERVWYNLEEAEAAAKELNEDKDYETRQ